MAADVPLGEAPLHDPVALTEWNRRAKALLGMEEEPSAWDVARAKIIVAAGENAVGETDSFSRRQEKIRTGVKSPATAKSREGAWEEERRKLAAMPELREELAKIIPIERAPGYRGPTGIRRPGRIAALKGTRAWGKVESAQRGNIQGRRARGITDDRLWIPAPAGETPWLLYLFTALKVKQRELSEESGIPRGTMYKWIRCADSRGHEHKERIALALRKLYPHIITMEAIRVARFGGRPTLPWKILPCLDPKCHAPVVKMTPAARQMFCDSCTKRRRRAQIAEASARARAQRKEEQRQEASAYRRAYYEAHREQIKAHMRDYYRKNSEELRRKLKERRSTPEARARAVEQVRQWRIRQREAKRGQIA